MPVTLGFAKNVARRAFTQLIDPAPNKLQQRRIWEHFGHRCAYCAAPLDRARKEGHIDHLVSASGGGRNDLSNRVLACAPCNEKEKREMDWEEFLLAKVGDAGMRKERRDRILAWRDGAISIANDPTLQAAVEAAGREVAELIDRKAKEIRALKAAMRPPRQPRTSHADGRNQDARTEAQLPQAIRPPATYRATRLSFRADIIEPLEADDVFRVETPQGSYQMSKSEFYAAFPNVVASASYQCDRVYHYSTTPKKAYGYRVAAEVRQGPPPPFPR